MKPLRLHAIICFLLTGAAFGLWFDSVHAAIAVFCLFLSAYAIKLSR